MPDTQTQILDLAESAMRARGYHAVSFRDLADAMGIKSASIHYHFRHKEDLGHAVVDRYATRVADALGDPAPDWKTAVRRFAQVYKDALATSDLQCLCGMLAAESAGLPDSVSARVSAFFESNLDWLQKALPRSVKNKRLLCLRVQSEVQGAMILAVNLGDPTILDKVSKAVISDA